MNVELWALDAITPYARNPRKNDAAVDKVAASLKEFGWRQPIVVDEEGVILAGHTRYMAARRLGMAEVPVHTASGLSPAQARAYRLADNRTGQEAEWDVDLLKLELLDLQLGKYDLELTGFNEAELWETINGPDFLPASEEEQGRLDEKAPVKCPECGHEFTP